MSLLDNKEFVFLIISGIFVYLLFVASLYFFQRKVIYYPNPSRQDRAVYKADDMAVVKVTTEDALELEGWYKAPQDNKPVIVVFHGNASHMGMSAWKVRAFMDAGYGALLPAYRGYAGNPGKPSEQGLYKDARGFLSWLITEKKILESRIVLLGESLGSGVAVEMAANDFPSVKAVILESPYTSFVDMAKNNFPYIPFMNLLVRDKYKNLDKIKNVKAPLFVVHGKRDMIVPFKLGKRLYDEANQPKEMVEMPMAGHNDLYMHGAEQRILHFLSGL